MLPVYFAFLAGHSDRSPLRGAVYFALGFTLLFTAMGAASGSLGSFIVSHRRFLEIACGTVIIVFGLFQGGLLRLAILEREWRPMLTRASESSPLLCGAAFGLGWTPCIGPLLATALMQAAASGSVLFGALMLLCYGTGIAAPFILTAVLFEHAKGALQFLKRNGAAVRRISGGVMVLCGLLMIAGVPIQLPAL